ncbi:hypothetical protein MMJ52_06320 [Enterococcus cecorum]|uniref:hypothetical protein n=1 Tax=Enterococcus cecorum TaxID=44008 RepID=UPI001FADB8FF|nr:hypothetical protein [Enterococcus cecorum]MCJ0543858.1 hypothetical protein [Enterococcus cecorum]MCJ0548346.1 hypothetical protein [Enterococcus cecorum]MDZ5570572.1 hypothetical protein [Enterococcus cecorum]MDZ5583635.1 hypothetical protein [Enterococcus cecorum]
MDKKRIVWAILLIAFLDGYFIYNHRENNTIYITNHTNFSFADMVVQFRGNVNQIFQAKKKMKIPKNFTRQITLQIKNKNSTKEHYISGYYEYAFKKTFNIYITHNTNNQLTVKIKE